MKRLATIITLIVSLLCVLSCQGEFEAALVDQEGIIDAFIQQYSDTCEVVRCGCANRVIIQPGKGNEIQAGDSVAIFYAGYQLTKQGASMFATDSMAVVSIDKGELIPGLYDGLIGMKQGEGSLILFTAKYGYGKEPLGLVPAKTALLFTVGVNNVYKK